LRQCKPLKSGYSYGGHSLQSTTKLVSLFAWSNVNTTPVVTDGQSTVTNPVSGNQMFFRLSQLTG
jgi:hypothetical protein